MKVPKFKDKFGTAFDEDLIGSDRRDRLYGFDGKDRLYAKAGDDELYGGGGNDLLDGGAGADIMFGGSGDDHYRVENLADVVSEETVAGVDDGGVDSVSSWITYSLGTFIEKLDLMGTQALNGTGNSLNNKLGGNEANNVLSGRGGVDLLYGNGGNDILIGGAGKDELYGGIGADTFVFGTADATSTDKVKDYSSSEDRIGIYASDYGLSVGNGLINDGAGKLVLDPTYFAAVTGSASTVQGTVLGHGQFVFSTTASTRTLMWDADGAGALRGVALATFNLDATLSAASFDITTMLPIAAVNDSPNPVSEAEGARIGFTINLVTASSAPKTFEKRVVAGADDVEQSASGSMSLNSSDLELIADAGTSQSVGIRFTAIDIPAGAIITSAYLQFQTDEVGSAATSLLIRGEDADDAAVFTSATNNVSSRATTDASAAWAPAAWTTVGEAGLAQRTSDLSAIVQEIVSRGGWLAGNDMAFIVTGSGTRTAEAFESGAATAPLLHIEYTTVPLSAPLSAPTNEDVVLTYSTVDGTALAGSDFVGVSFGQVTIPAGSTSATVLIQLLADDLPEPVEAFTLQLHSAVTATSGTALSIEDSTGGATIAMPIPRVVASTDMTAYGSTDAAGIAFVPELNLMFISDSEVEEDPFFGTTNLWAVRLDGTLVESFSLLNFTDEPTGLSYDVALDRLYITDDDQYKVFWVDPDNPTVKLGETADLRLIGADDPEDVAINPNDGHLFVMNGDSRKIVEIDDTGTLAYSTIALPAEIKDPEAVAYDVGRDVFYVGGGFSSNIWVVDRTGAIMMVLDVLGGYRHEDNNTRTSVKDIVFAPSSDPDDDPGKLNLFVSDYGWSHVSDGRMLEIDLNGGLLL